MKPKETTKATNIKHNAVHRWKQTYDNDPKKNIPLKKPNRSSNRPVNQLSEKHKDHLINFLMKILQRLFKYL